MSRTGVHICGAEHPHMKGRRCQLDVTTHEHAVDRPFKQRFWHYSHDGTYGYSWKRSKRVANSAAAIPIMWDEKLQCWQIQPGYRVRWDSCGRVWLYRGPRCRYCHGARLVPRGPAQSWGRRYRCADCMAEMDLYLGPRGAAGPEARP